MTGCRGTQAVSPSGKAPGTTLRWKAGARILSEHPASEAAAGHGGVQKSGAAASKVRSPAAGEQLEQEDRDWSKDGASSAESNPDGTAAGGATKEPRRRADITPPAAPGDVPAVRPSLRRVRRGFGGAPGGAAAPLVHRTRQARFRLFLTRAAEPSRAKPSLMPARERVNGLLESALPHTTRVSQNRPAEAQTRRASSP